MFVQPANLHGKNFNVGHCMQAFQPHIFIPAMLIGTMNFYSFTPHSVTLTLPGGHKVSAKKAKPIRFIFSHAFEVIRMKFNMGLKWFKLNILMLFLILLLDEKGK